MSVQSIRLQISNYQPVDRGLIHQTHSKGHNFKMIDKLNLQSRETASKIAFQAVLERALLNKKYWDELLDKLRKMGGGGGGSDLRFDRIAVSMQLMNFLSNKTIYAMVKNFTQEFLKSMDNFLNKSHIFNQNVFVAGMQKIVGTVFNGITNIISLITRRDAPSGRLYSRTSNVLLSLAGAMSFQINKLKEILEKELKRFLKKLKITLLDFFAEQ